MILIITITKIICFAKKFSLEEKKESGQSLNIATGRQTWREIPNKQTQPG